ncbi:hypothetical protein CKO23_18025 [Thiocystis violacea]|nr:hypothetical protein [Thiocystis violacea]
MIPLDPRARADAVVKQVLRELLDILEANVAGARANWDSEFLHDLRVATRRTRSVLTQLEDVFPRERIGGFRDGFAWLQQVTGPVRDLDVYLLAFDGYRASLPPSLGPKLEPLRAFLRTRHEAAHAELAAALDSGRFKDLVRDWRDVLEAPAASPSAAADAARPIKRVVDARIRRLAKRVRREGRAIQADSPPTQLHALRKRCKKLRYLMELFKSLYPDAAIKPIIKQLKVLLDQLGTFQDLAVQAEHLEDIAEQMYAAGEAAPGTLLAMGALVGSLLERQMRARDGFAEVFAAFDDPGQWARYRALFWASGSKRKGR